MTHLPLTIDVGYFFAYNIDMTSPETAVNLDTTALVHSVVNIDRSALHAEVAARLKEMIIDGSLAPGARLNERILCEELAVSRTPLREAFKMLAGAGLVELLPNRGAVVARMDLADIESTFAVIASLEGLAGELAATKSRTRNWPKFAPCSSTCWPATHGATCPATFARIGKYTPVSARRRATRC